MKTLEECLLIIKGGNKLSIEDVPIDEWIPIECFHPPRWFTVMVKNGKLITRGYHCPIRNWLRESEAWNEKQLRRVSHWKQIRDYTFQKQIDDEKISKTNI